MKKSHPHAYPDGGSLSTEEASALRRDLLAWYDAQRRTLPWREQPSLYGIWVSEVMLQQTTVEAVVPFWQRFMQRFPSVKALAEASEDEVLACWSGLGYYSRARHLHQAARQIAEDRAGLWPASCQEWRSLPGIGEYTSGAIASIALQERVPAVDANARRVLQRWLAAGPESLEELKPAALRMVAADLVDSGRPGDWNQALMELGALLCRPQAPACHRCPVHDHCRAGRSGRAADISSSLLRPATRKVVVGQLLVCRADDILLWPPGRIPVVNPPGGRPALRSDFSRLHRGLWGLPGTPWFPRPTAQEMGPWLKPDFWSAWWEETLASAGYGVHQFSKERRGCFKHSITRYQLEVEVTILRLSGDAQLPSQGPALEESPPPFSDFGFVEKKDKIKNIFSGVFFSKKDENLPISTLTRKSMAYM